jgi:hypothetical protein
MRQHETGNSGATLEAPLSLQGTRAGIPVECYCIFEEALLLRVAQEHAHRAYVPLHDALRYVVNVAEAVGCALLRTHVADPSRGGGGSNCTAGGQVFGPASQRINSYINSVRSAYAGDQARIAAILDEPAAQHVRHDPGLMVRLDAGFSGLDCVGAKSGCTSLVQEILAIVSRGQGRAAAEHVTLKELLSSIQSASGKRVISCS